MADNFFPKSVQQFDQLYNKIEKKSYTDQKIQEIKNIAWDYFLSTGLPLHRRGNEEWKYTNLNPISEINFNLNQSNSDIKEINKLIPISSDWHNIIFIDGKISNQNFISNKEIIISKIDSINLPDEFATLAKPDSSPFTALNTAFFSEGILIEIPDNVILQKDLNITFVNSNFSENLITFPRVFLKCGENSELKLIENYINLSNSVNLTLPVLEIVQSKNSKIEHFRVQIENPYSFNIASTRILQKSNSNFFSTSFSTGAKIGRNDIHVLLDAPEAECGLYGLYISNGDQQQDSEISTTHSKPNCTSKQYYKGILSGNSKAVFSGKILVDKDAQQSDADQKDLNLLLSRNSEVYTKPSLEIYADDVTCAHGATAGNIDMDTLFYLQTRGLDLETAKGISIKGFAEEMINRFKPKDLRNYISNFIDDLIPVLRDQSDTIGTF